MMSKYPGPPLDVSWGRGHPARVGLLLTVAKLQRLLGSEGMHPKPPSLGGWSLQVTLNLKPLNPSFERGLSEALNPSTLNPK